MRELLIRGGNVVFADRVERADVAIAEGRFIEISPDISGAAREEIDATGLHIFPGVIDPHVHFNEPGRAEWEGFSTGSSALAAGGGTLFFDMPLNSSPPVLDGAAFDAKLAAAKGKSFTDLALWGGLTPGSLDQMEELAERGVVGFKAFMCDSGIEDFPRADDLTLYHGMLNAKRLGLPVAVHAENQEITATRTAQARERGLTTWRHYLWSRPSVAEVEATQRAIIFAAETGCRLHIVHVSNSRCSELVRLATAHLSADVTCETCPHYLTLADVDLERLGALAKCAPPLRSDADMDKLWQDLANDRFAFVASDHSPAPAAMKSGDDALAVWGGIAGIQSTLSILLSRRSSLKLPLIAKLTSTNAAKRFGVAQKGAIEIGFDADVALVDVNACFELQREDLLDRHKLSPYVGRTFHGVVRRTILRGQTIFADGKIIGPPHGKFLRPTR